MTSRDAHSPKTSPRNSPRASPRESLNSSPGQGISPRNSPPTLGPFPPASLFRNLENEADILDFSLSKATQGYREELLSMTSKSPLRGSPPPLGIPRTGDSPLDLSVPRKRAADALLEAAAAQGKMNPMDLAKLNPWGFPLPHHLASTLALRPDLAALKSDLNLWNGKFKPETPPATKLPPFPIGGHSGPTPSEASKALERMSELSKLGGDSGIGSGLGMGVSSDLFRSSNIGNSSSGRTNAWQSHWLSKGQDATKDVLKCVWCKASFNTLADLTTHMKEAKHCGVNLPPPIPPTSGASLPPHMPSKLNCKPPVSSPGTASSSSSNDLISSIKETMPLPRKLVRGQDVWLGKGAEQTRQILKCMWCGQSFKSLAEMTRHMQQTQHYTNIISQEQIISWKSPEEKTNSQTHVNAVLTCKVCDQAFSSLKELSNHMVKYAHYKEHIMRSITESGSRRRQTREKRKKSLPVRKLLELERAQQEMRATNEYGRVKEGTPSRITCEKCGDKIDTCLFVEHIRTCVGVMSRDLLKSSMLSPDPDQGSRYDSSKDTDSEGKMTPDKSKDIDPLRDTYRDLQQRDKRETVPDSEGEKVKSEETKETPSVLCALEKLIEKSFDSGKSKPGSSPLGSSILRRLGIDEGTDYSKPLMDPQLMGMYATFSRLHTGHGSSFNLPPSFVPGDRSYGMRNVDTGHSPSGDSDTRDTFPRSPLRPSSRPDSRPASTGSVTRDGSASERSVEMIRNDLHLSMTDDNQPTENGTDHSDNEIDSGASRDGSGVKQEPSDVHEAINERDPSQIIQEEPKVKEELRIKDEFKLKKEVDRVDNDMGPGLPYKNDSDRRSPTPLGRHVTSPAGSSRSGTPHSETSSNRGPSGGALGGLSALLGSVGSDTPGSSHPLAALQKLCDKTETQPRPPVTTSSLGPQTNPGAILAFSWACNDAVTADSIMKCAFCDTPFISKGAYRHHLSKMHFVKDGIIPETGISKQSQSSKVPPSAPTPPAPVVDDSPHSKFLKYTELAKQLSSK